MNQNKNTYEITDLVQGGGKQYGSDIHGESVQRNVIMWDMIKILNKHQQFGFHITSKISTKKIFITLYHKDEKTLKIGKELLSEFKGVSDTIFLAKVREPKKKKNIKLWIILIATISAVSTAGYYIYINKNSFINIQETSSVKKSHKENNNTEEKELEETIIRVDIKTLKVLQENFSKQEKDPLQEKITKTMEIGVAIISSLVPQEEKDKYSSKALVESFKGKGGIKFELEQDQNISDKDFNMSVKELNNYAMDFVKSNKTSTLLNNYDYALKADTNATKDDLMVAHNKRGALYKDTHELKKSEKAFEQSLQLSQELVKKEPLKYTNSLALNFSEMASIHKKLNKKEEAKKELYNAEKNYLKVLGIYRQLAKKDLKKVQTNLAWSLNMLANFYHDKKKTFEKSIKYREEAVKNYQELSKNEPKKFEKELFQTLNSLANSYSALHNLNFAKKYYTQSISLIEKRIKEKEAEPYIIPLLTIYNKLAWIDLSQSKFLEARKKLEQTLSLAKLKKEVPKDIFSVNYSYWGYLSLLKNDTKKALFYYLKSFNLNKRFESAQSYVTILIKKERYVESERFFKLMLKTYEKDEEKTAKTLVMYGKFYLNINPKNAKIKFQKALNIYRKISKDSNATEYIELRELIKFKEKKKEED